MKAIITDFDGTLVNTMTANFYAYRDAIYELTKNIITEDEYKKYFGLRFDDLMKALNITDNEIGNNIKKKKAELYKKYYLKYTIINNELLNFLYYMKSQGMMIAIASTASKENLYNVLDFYKITNLFNIIICGEDVDNGKPNPEVYLKTLKLLNINAEDALVFEDSDVGLEAAKSANIKTIKISI